MSASPAASDQLLHAMRRAWWPVARLRDLDRPRAATLLGESLVVYRAAGGRSAVASSRCPHRGADLILGSVVGEAIQCAYHGWQFGAEDGRCVRVPSLTDEAPIPRGVALKTYRCQEYLGLVWTCLDTPAAPRPDPEELRGIDWQYEAADTFPVNAGVVAATENFRDVAHFAFVHRRTMGEVPAVIEPLNVHREGTEVFMERWYTAHGGEGGEVFESSNEIRYAYHAIAPAFACLVHHYGERGRRYTIQACSPVSLTECVIYWVEGISAGFQGPSLAECIAANREVFLEDVPILNSLRPPEVPFDGEAPDFSTAADKYTLAVRRAVLEFVTIASNPTDAQPPKPRTRDNRP